MDQSKKKEGEISFLKITPIIFALAVVSLTHARRSIRARTRTRTESTQTERGNGLEKSRAHAMSGALVGLTLGAAAGAWAEREGLVPKELPSMSDVPTDWSSGMSSLSKVRETLFGGASVEDVVEEKVISDAVSSVSKESGKIFNSVTTFGTSPSSSVSALQVAALLSGAATGAIIAYYGTDKSLEKAKEFAIAFKKKVYLFDLWLKDIIFDVAWPSLVKTFAFIKTKTGKLFVYAQTLSKKTFTMTKMGELKRIVSADKIYKAKDSVVVMITPTLIVVKNVAINGVERATLFSKASYMKAMAFADTLVNKMNNKKNEEQEKKKTKKQPAPKTKATTPAPSSTTTTIPKPNPSAPTA